MIDRFILPIQSVLLAPFARGLCRMGIRADQISIAGLVFGICAFVALATGFFGPALGLIVLNRIADGLDGAVARQSGPTDRGAFLDITLDFAFYALIPLGLAFADPDANALAAATLIAAFIGTGSSFLAFAVVAERRGLRSTVYPAKGIYYLGGLTEGAETIAVFLAMCLWPGWFAPLAWIFAALCLVTTVIRWHMGWQMFSAERAPEVG